MTKYLSRLMLVQAGWVAVVLVLLVAYGFLSAAGYLFLRDVTGAPMAALICGVVTLGLAALIALSTHLMAAKLSIRRTHALSRDDRGTASGEYGTAAEVGSVVGEEIASLVRAHSQGAVVVSLLAGLAVGVSPRLRRTLRDIL